MNTEQQGQDNHIELSLMAGCYLFPCLITITEFPLILSIVQSILSPLLKPNCLTMNDKAFNMYLKAKMTAMDNKIPLAPVDTK